LGVVRPAEPLIAWILVVLIVLFLGVFFRAV
jgi:hypothetical protein